jgi:hypothetical protein
MKYYYLILWDQVMAVFPHIHIWFFVVVGSCQWGETMSLNCGHQQAYCSSSSWYEYGERWWNGVDRRKPKNSENLSHCHFVYYKSHMDYPVSNPASMVRRQRLTAWTVAWPKFFFYKNLCPKLGEHVMSLQHYWVDVLWGTVYVFY